MEGYYSNLNFPGTRGPISLTIHHHLGMLVVFSVPIIWPDNDVIIHPPKVLEHFSRGGYPYYSLATKRKVCNQSHYQWHSLQISTKSTNQFQCCQASGVTLPRHQSDKSSNPPEKVVKCQAGFHVLMEAWFRSCFLSKNGWWFVGSSC